MSFIMITTSAKTLDESTDWSAVATSVPENLETTSTLVNYLKGLSVKKLAQVMQISPQLAQTNRDRIQGWTKQHDSKSAKPAILLYKGDVYKQFDATSFSKDQQRYAQEHLRISSGLYGLIRPYDLIQPYRLEMRTKLPTTKNKAMNDFWSNKATETLNSDVHKTNAQFVLNLASKEYAKVLKPKKLKVPIITAEFQEEKDGQLKTVAIFSKKARGMLVGYAIKHQIKNLDGLKKFDTEDYRFVEADEKRILFARKYRTIN